MRAILQNPGRERHYKTNNSVSSTNTLQRKQKMDREEIWILKGALKYVFKKQVFRDAQLSGKRKIKVNYCRSHINCYFGGKEVLMVRGIWKTSAVTGKVLYPGFVGGIMVLAL